MRGGTATNKHLRLHPIHLPMRDRDGKFRPIPGGQLAPDCWVYEEEDGLYIIFQDAHNGMTGEPRVFLLSWRKIRGMIARKDRKE